MKPLWQEEFSVFTADERYVNRRQFTKFLTLTSLAMLCGNLWILARSWFRREPYFPRRVVARVGEVPVGGVKLFAYPAAEDPCILVRTAADTYAAYSQKCTHLSCAVYYEAAQNRLECPCHKGYFSVHDGSAQAGPPQRGLARVALERRGEELVAVGMESKEPRA
jgi:Rieske Fe-S protein